MFTDLNKHAVNTTKSLNTLYDSKDPMAVMTKKVVDQIPFLRKYTDKEKDILGKYSSSLFTLNTFYTANKTIIGRHSLDSADVFLYRFWSFVCLYMSQWKELEHKEITKVDLRENYIATQSIVIQALGRIGHYLFMHPEIDLEIGLKGLEKVDWHRNSSQWLMRAINQNGRIITNKKASVRMENGELDKLMLTPSKRGDSTISASSIK